MDTTTLHVVKRSTRYVDILLHGKPYRINSWLTWCVPYQHPTLGLLWMAAAANLAPKGLTGFDMQEVAASLTVPGSCERHHKEWRYRFI
jgi:hypothetical protein